MAGLRALSTALRLHWTTTSTLPCLIGAVAAWRRGFLDLPLAAAIVAAMALAHIAMEIGEYEVLPVVEEVPVICGVHATDPRRRMWHWLGKVKEMGFSGVNNFPTHTIVDGHFRQVLEETGMSVKKE